MTSDWWTGSTDNREVTELNCEESSDRVCARVVHQSDAQEQRKSVLLAKNIGGRAYHAKRCQNNCITAVPNTKMCHTIHQPDILEWQASVLRPCLTPGLIRLLRSHRSSTAQLRLHITYSGHGRADIPPLSTTLGLVPTQSLLHLTIYPALTWVLHVPVISTTLYHFHRTWFILLGPDFILPGPDLVLSPVIPCPLLRLFTCHHKYSSLALT